MDYIDKQIVGIVQKDSRSSSAQIAEAVGVSVSTANERVRKLSNAGIIKAWCAVLDPAKIGNTVCAFVYVDMDYEGEAEACRALCSMDEVQEVHHISGAHSYLLKIRLADNAALQSLLHDRIKALPAVRHTESIIVLQSEKETPQMVVS
ncbi:MAG: Lrp/AsnC family transcriptional regulator [Robiginitomaculum sp.]|nr:Lrp/AsnC family transcriptional regulator [Robiginitomaculum sp.]